MPKKVYKGFVHKLSDFFAETLDLGLLLVQFPCQRLRSSTG